MKRKFWLSILSIAAASCLVGGLAACNNGGGDKTDDGGGENNKPVTDSTQVVLADFEQWAPDFQILRTMANFGAVDVNEEAAYVKTGKQSAKLYVMGNEGSSIKPYIYLPTVSEYFDYDYSKFEKFDKVSAWLYNPNEAGLEVEIGAITTITDITTTTQVKGTTKELAQGWNQIVWNVNASLIATATGFSAYNGVNGVYFKFNATGATQKADADVFYLDDVVLHYGETEQTITQLSPEDVDREEASITYGAYSEQFRYTNFDPIPLSEIEGKALHIELKLHGDGMAQIGYSRAIDWGHLSGLARIYKNGDNYRSEDINGSPVGKVTPIEDSDGWISFDYNYSEWYGAYLHATGSTQVEQVQNEGTWEPSVDVSIFWLSLKVVDAYEGAESDFPEHPDAIKYEAGHDPIRYNKFTPIAVSDVVDKAISIQLNLLEDGKITVAFTASSWAEITYLTVIEKNGDEYTSKDFWHGNPNGKINVLEDGWIEYVVDYYEFDTSKFDSSSEIAQVYVSGKTENDGGSSEGPFTIDVGIDWGSIAIVDGYIEPEPPEFPDRLNAKTIAKGSANGTQFAFPAIEFSELEGKAIHFEFYFKEEGSVAFAIADDWHNATGPITLTYNGTTVTADKGIVYSVGEGWWAWEHNFVNFSGDGMSESAKLDVIMKGWDIDWNADVAIDLDTFRAVAANTQENPYPDRPKASVYNEGDSFERHPITPVSLSAVQEGGAISIELKFLGDGEIVIGFQASDWGEIAYNTVVIKNGDEYTSKDFWHDTNEYGRITVLDDGWIRLVIDYDEFKAENVIKYTEIGLVYITGRAGTSHEKPLAVGVAIDWDSIAVVEGYIEPEVPEFPDRLNAKTIAKGSANGTQFAFPAVQFSELEGKAIHFEFYFKEEGSVTFAIADDWRNATGPITLTYDGSTVTASKGIVLEIGEGWWAWEHNRVNFGGDGLAASSKLDVIMKGWDAEWGADVAIDLDSFRAVNANDQEEPPAQPDPDHPNTAEFGSGDSLGFNTDIPVEQLEGKAIHFEFKIEDDSAEFGFAMAERSSWANCTGPVVIRKVNGEWVSLSWVDGAPYGKLIDLGNGWYAWECNRSAWTADRQADGWGNNPTSIGLLIRTGAQVGTAIVDLDSLKVVDALEQPAPAERPNATEYAAGSSFERHSITPISLADVQAAGAVKVQLKLLGDGEVVVGFLASDWAELAFMAVVTKSGNTYTSTNFWNDSAYGQIIVLGDGWIELVINYSDFKSENISNPKYTEIALFYVTGREGTSHEKPLATGVIVDWDSLGSTRSMTVYKKGDSFERRNLATPISLSDVQAAGAISFKLKFFEDGAMTFALCATSWAELSYLVVVEKEGNSYSAHRFWEGTSIGKINILEDGWIEVVINYSEFNQELLASNTEIGMIYVTGGTQGSHEAPFAITVAVDWEGIELVEAY